MSTLKKATANSSTFWINLFVALAGAALMFFQNGSGDTGTAVPAPIAGDTAAILSPDVISLIASTLGLSTNADVIGAITITLALINQLLRYKTQRKLEKQLNG